MQSASTRVCCFVTGGVDFSLVKIFENLRLLFEVDLQSVYNMLIYFLP